MKEIKIRYALGILLLTTVAASGFASRSEGNPNGRYRVLIATESTSYKNQLVEVLIKNLNDGNVSITVVDHMNGGLKGVDPSLFNAVFITNSGAQAKVRPEVMNWLRSVKAKDDNVILHTTQTTNWNPPVEVDSITSASQRSNIEKLSDDITRRIRVFFKDEE
jgi:hypothetical protein